MFIVSYFENQISPIWTIILKIHHNPHNLFFGYQCVSRYPPLVRCAFLEKGSRSVLPAGQLLTSAIPSGFPCRSRFPFIAIRATTERVERLIVG